MLKNLIALLILISIGSCNENISYEKQLDVSTISLCCKNNDYLSLDSIMIEQNKVYVSLNKKKGNLLNRVILLYNDNEIIWDLLFKSKETILDIQTNSSIDEINLRGEFTSLDRFKDGRYRLFLTGMKECGEIKFKVNGTSIVYEKYSCIELKTHSH